MKVGFKRFLLELEHLHDTLSKKGDAFLGHLLNDTVVINIKVDQSAFVLRKQDGNITYHGREGRGDINKIKRAGMDTYEEGIKHIESRPVSKLPDGIEVYLELFSDKWKTKVQYKTKPKNNLIISFIKQGGKTLLPNDPLNKTVASILDISPPPVLFEGRLNDNQKTAIRSFVSASAEQRQAKYGESKFLDFIMSMFVTPKEFEWLQEGGYEGVVFYFKDNQYSAKIVDPMFTAGKQEEHTEGMDDFRKALVDFVHDYLKSDLDGAADTFTKSPEMASADDLYIAFIAHLTRYMVQKHGAELRSLDKHEHEQKARRWSNISLSMIPGYMKQLVKDHWWVEELFTMLLNNLQKEKKAINTKQGLTRERKDAINDMVARLRGRGLVK